MSRSAVDADDPSHATHFVDSSYGRVVSHFHTLRVDQPSGWFD
jgi:hypothetical protein